MAASSASPAQPMKKTRVRQQKVCSECHKRKMKCNRETPCDNCIKRGNPELCHIADAVQELKQRLHNIGANGNQKQQRSPTSSSNGTSNFSSPSGQRETPRDDLQDDPPQIGLLFLGPGSSSRVYNEFRVSDSSQTQEQIVEPIVGDTMLFERFAHRSTSGIFSNLGDTGLAGISVAFTALLPPSSDCHSLLNEYYEYPFAAGIQHIMPRCCLQGVYDELWANDPIDLQAAAVAARSIQAPTIALPSQLSFLSLLFISLAIGGMARSRSEAMPNAHLQDTCSRMFEYSRLALLESDTRERPSLCTISSLILQTVYLKMMTSPSVGWTGVGQAIRHAHALGLHRDPQASPAISPFEGEIRRRLWWILVCMDKSQSVAFGRPYLIQSRHCNVKLPANIYRRDYTPEGLSNVRPSSECTETIMTFCSIQISQIQARLADEVLLGDVAAYSTILSIDNELLQMDSGLPSAFRNPSPEERVQKPFLAAGWTAYQTQWYYLRILLHRSLLMRSKSLRYSDSEIRSSADIAVQASQKWIALLREDEPSTPRNTQSFFCGSDFLPLSKKSSKLKSSTSLHHLVVVSCFEPALTLSIVLLRGDLPEKRRSMIMHVQDVVRLLETMGQNAAGQAAVKLLRELEKLYHPAQQSTMGTDDSASTILPSQSQYQSQSQGPAGSQDFLGRASILPSQSIPDTQYYGGMMFGPDQQTTQITTLGSVPDASNLQATAAAPTAQSLDWHEMTTTSNMSGHAAWPVSMPLLAGDSDFNDWLNQIMQGLPKETHWV